jgi:hypothetical protein
MAKYRKLDIYLTKEQRKAFEMYVRRGVTGAMELRRANVLLLADQSEGRKKTKDLVIAKMFGITPQAVHDIKARFLDREAEGSASGDEQEIQLSGIKRKKRETPPVAPKCNGEVEANIIAIACSAPPEGRSRWTLTLIAEKAVELKCIDSISHTQVSRILKKTNLSLT